MNNCKRNDIDFFLLPCVMVVVPLSSAYLTTSLKTSSCWLMWHQCLFLLLHPRCHWGKSRKLVNKVVHSANLLLGFEWWHLQVPKRAETMPDAFNWQYWWLVQLSKKVFCRAFVSLLTWKGCRPSAYPRVTDLWCHGWPLSSNSGCHFWCYDSPLETLPSAITSPHIWDMKGDQRQYVQSQIWSRALSECFSDNLRKHPKVDTVKWLQICLNVGACYVMCKIYCSLYFSFLVVCRYMGIGLSAQGVNMNRLPGE